MTVQQWEGPRTEGYRQLYFTTYGNNSFIYTLSRFNEQDLLITDIFSCRGLCFAPPPPPPALQFQLNKPDQLLAVVSYLEYTQAGLIFSSGFLANVKLLL